LHPLGRGPYVTPFAQKSAHLAGDEIVHAPGTDREFLQLVAETINPIFCTWNVSSKAEMMPTVRIPSRFCELPATIPAHPPSASKRQKDTTHHAVT